MVIAKSITFQNLDGQPVTTHVFTGRELTKKREKFCQLIVEGATHVDALIEAYDRSAEIDRRSAAEEACHLLGQTDIVLRIQELRRPVVRKVARKLEYTLQKALEQCETAWNLAFAQGDAKALIKAIELQGRFAKLLADQVNVTHRHGLLDDAATEVLLAMRKQIEDLKLKTKSNGPKLVNGGGEIIEATPYTPRVSQADSGSIETVP